MRPESPTVGGGGSGASGTGHSTATPLRSEPRGHNTKAHGPASHSDPVRAPLGEQCVPLQLPLRLSRAGGPSGQRATTLGSFPSHFTNLTTGCSRPAPGICQRRGSEGRGRAGPSGHRLGLRGQSWVGVSGVLGLLLPPPHPSASQTWKHKSRARTRTARVRRSLPSWEAQGDDPRAGQGLAAVWQREAGSLGLGCTWESGGAAAAWGQPGVSGVCAAVP